MALTQKIKKESLLEDRLQAIQDSIRHGWSLQDWFRSINLNRSLTVAQRAEMLQYLADHLPKK